MTIDINKIINNSKNFSSIAPTRSGSSVFSFGVVNPAGNTKRLSFSKALCEKINITEEEYVYIAISAEDNAVIIGNSDALNHGYKCKLSKSGEKKLSYNSTAVHAISDTFKLPFENRTSLSFSHMEFEEIGDTIVAIVHFTPEIIQEASKH